MKRSSTWFLRGMVVFMGLIAVAVAVFALPSAWKGGAAEFPVASLAVHLIVICLYLTVPPFLIGLWQTMKLLNYIDSDRAFSELSLKALQNIKICWTIIAVIYLIIVPLLFPIADADDAPGLILVGAAIACAPIAVAVFAAVLQKLLKNALEMKSEIELTV